MPAVVSARPRCEVVIPGYNKWIRQLVSGFYDLAGRGAIDLDLRVGEVPQGSIQFVTATIEGVRVVYDLHDGYNFLLNATDPDGAFDDLLDGCDLWFKATSIASRHEHLRNRDKILPLGLGSIFFGSHANPYDRGWRPFNPRQVVENLVGATSLGASLTRHNSRHMWPEHYEGAPSLGDGSVLFVARVWDPLAPEVENGEVRAERELINELRSGIVREAREAFGPRFVGGIQRTPFAEKFCPDLIFDGPEAVNRWPYLRAVTRCSVGIASAGLHGTAGSKMSEYVAASRAVVAEPVNAEVPGGFSAGRNYLEAATATQCVEACNALLSDPEALLAMSRANHAYYESYMRPAAFVWRTVQAAIGR